MFVFCILKKFQKKDNNPILIQFKWNAQFAHIVIIGLYIQRIVLIVYKAKFTRKIYIDLGPIYIQ